LHFRSGTWEESARSLLRVLEPLRPGKSSPGRAGRVRQLLKRTLSLLLPRRRFLVQGSATTKAVCLTFDDGPHPEHTPRLLDVLKEHDVRATFFVVGEQAERHPELVRRIAEEGHAVGNHTFHHAAPGSTPAPQLLAEVERTDRLLSGLTGVRSFPFRPPQGKLTAAKLWRLWGTGRSVVLWNVDPKDYAADSTEEVRDWFGRRPLRAGDVVLLHDRVPHAVNVVPELVAAARGQGLTFQTVPEWLR
jgi:peptidoglycan/xylan/chitin deacetylase (PgdA/CDA1 family)